MRLHVILHMVPDILPEINAELCVQLCMACRTVRTETAPARSRMRGRIMTFYVLAESGPIHVLP